MIDQVICTFLSEPAAEEEIEFWARKVQPGSFGLAPALEPGSRTVPANLVGTTRGQMNRGLSWAREDGRGRTRCGAELHSGLARSINGFVVHKSDEKDGPSGE